MPDTPWLNVDEGIFRLGQIGMFMWIPWAKPNPPQWEGPEDIPFTEFVRYRIY